MSMFLMGSDIVRPVSGGDDFDGLTPEQVDKRLSQMRMRCDVARRGLHDRQSYQWLQAASRAVNGAIVAMDELRQQ